MYLACRLGTGSYTADVQFPSSVTALGGEFSLVSSRVRPRVIVESRDANLGSCMSPKIPTHC